MRKLLLSVALFFVWVTVLYLIPVDLGVEKNTNRPSNGIEQSLFSIDINEVQTIPSVNTIDPSLCINSTKYFHSINSKNKNFIFGL